MTKVLKDCPSSGIARMVLGEIPTLYWTRTRGGQGWPGLVGWVAKDDLQRLRSSFGLLLLEAET